MYPMRGAGTPPGTFPSTSLHSQSCSSPLLSPPSSPSLFSQISAHSQISQKSNLSMSSVPATSAAIQITTGISTSAGSTGLNALSLEEIIIDLALRNLRNESGVCAFGMRIPEKGMQLVKHMGRRKTGHDRSR